MPKTSELDAQAKSHELTDLYVGSTRAAFLLSLFIGSLILLDGKALLRIWLGERFLASYSLLLVLTAGYVAVMAQLPSVTLISPKGGISYWAGGRSQRVRRTFCSAPAGRASTAFWGWRWGLRLQCW